MPSDVDPDRPRDPKNRDDPGYKPTKRPKKGDDRRPNRPRRPEDSSPEEESDPDRPRDPKSRDDPSDKPGKKSRKKSRP